MSDNELKNLLEGLFSDFPTEPPPPSPAPVPGEALLAGAVDALTDPVLIADRDGIIQFVNPAYQALAGCSAQELVGQKCRFFESGRLPEALVQEIRDTVLSGQVWQGQLGSSRPDGSSHPAMHTLSPILDETGQVHYFVALERELPARPESPVMLAQERDLMPVLVGISQIAASSFELNDLTQQVVDEAQRSLDLDFAGVYLFDEEEDRAAVLRAGSGDLGQRLVEQGHRLEMEGDSTVAWAIANGEPRLVLDQDPQAAGLALPGIRSLVALPLLARGRAIGALTLQSSQPARFAPEELPVMQNMADQVASAIERARLFWERERRVTELAVVNEIGRVISLKVNQEELLETVYGQISRIFDTSSFYIAICDTSSDQVAIPLYFDHGQRMEPVLLEGRSGFTGYIIETRRPILLRNLEANRAFRERNQIALIGDEARSWMGVPLTTGDEIVGVMALQSYDQEHIYDRQDLTLFFTIADQVAAAIQNMRLLAESRRRAQELELLNQAAQTIGSMLDLKQVLVQIADTIKQQYGHYFVGISLLEGDRLVFQASSTIGDTGERLALVGFEFAETASLIGSVIQSGEPVLVNDVLQDPRYMSLEELPETRSELDLPIRHRGEVIGVLDVQNTRAGAFSPADVNLLQSLANQAGAAIENAQLFEQSLNQLKDLEIIQAAVSELAAALTVEEVTEILLPRVADTVRADGVSMFLLRGEKEMERVGIWPAPEAGEEAPGSRIALEDFPLTQQVIWERQPLALSVGDPRLQQHARKTFEASGIVASATIPLLGREGVLGTLSVSLKQAGRSFSRQDLRLLQTLADQATTALEKARLLQQAQKRAEELAALQQTALELAGEQRDLDSLLDIVVRRTMDLVRSDGAGVWLWRQESQELELVITYQVGEVEFGGRRLKPGEGLTGRAYAEKKSQSVDDYRSWAGRSGSFADAPFASALAVPMLWESDVIGALVLTRSWENDPYTASEKNLAELLAVQAATFVQNARLFEETDRRAEELSVLNELTRVLTGQLKAQQVMEEAYRGASRLLNVPNFYIGLYDPRRDEIAFVFDESESAIDQEFEVISAGEGITGYIIRHRLPMLMPDRLEERMEALGIETVGEVAASWIGVPMIVGERVLGVMGAQSFTTPQAWDQHDLELMIAIGNQTAVALQNAQLFEQAQRQLAELSALQETTAALAAAPSFDEAVSALLPRVANAVKADQASMFLVRDEQMVRVGSYPARPEGELSLGQTYALADYPLTQQALRTRRPLAVLADDPTLQPHARDAYQAAGITASATIPLISRNEILGFLTLSLKQVGAAFGDRDISLLQTLADQAMIAFERVRLLDALTQRAGREQALREITTRVRSSTNPAAIMRTAVQELGDALGRPTFVRLGSAQELIRGGNGDAKQAKGGA